MFVVVVPMATALAVAAGFAIAYIAIGIAFVVGFAVSALGNLIGSVFGSIVSSAKLPSADPIWATTAAVVYFFYYFIHACIYQVPWNYVSMNMIGMLLVATALHTVVITLVVALAAQLISLTAVFHHDAPLYYPLVAIAGGALDWLGYMHWPLFVIPATMGLTIYFAFTRSRYAPVEIGNA